MRAYGNACLQAAARLRYQGSLSMYFVNSTESG